MKTFIDTATGQAWQFEDDVIVRDNQFFAPHAPDTPLNVPTTLVPGELPEPATPPLDGLKAAKRTEINDACLAAIDGGFEHDGHAYDSDERSKSNIIGTATGVTAGIPLPDGFTWRTHDNQDIPMDGPGVIALGASLLQHISAQYARSWQLKAQIDAAESPPDLALIVWETPQAA